jgi:hypothetical protein
MLFLQLLNILLMMIKIIMKFLLFLNQLVTLMRDEIWSTLLFEH